VPILAVSPHRATLRRAALFWGVQPLRHAALDRSDRSRMRLQAALVRRGYVRSGDRIAWLGGWHDGGTTTDFLRLEVVGAGRRPGRAVEARSRPGTHGRL
jgi:pyruvate kinase